MSLSESTERRLGVAVGLAEVGCLLLCGLPTLLFVATGAATTVSFLTPLTPMAHWWHAHMHPWEPLLYLISGVLLVLMLMSKVHRWRKQGLMHKCEQTGKRHWPHLRHMWGTLLLVLFFVLSFGVMIGHRLAPTDHADHAHAAPAAAVVDDDHDHAADAHDHEAHAHNH